MTPFSRKRASVEWNTKITNGENIRVWKNGKKEDKARQLSEDTANQAQIWTVYTQNKSFLRNRYTNLRGVKLKECDKFLQAGIAQSV